MSMWSHPVHPTQIYESAACIAIALVCLVVVAPKKRYHGQVFAWFLGLYAVARFVIEFLRRDDRGAFLGLSTSQLIGVGLIAAAAAVHAIRRRRPGPAGDAPGVGPYRTT
jgi:phosphatidylglycerol:prolipoprotein diacylglycerol transferase